MPAAIPLVAAGVGAAGSIISAKSANKGSNKASNASIASQRLRDDYFKNIQTQYLNPALNRSADQAVAGFSPDQTAGFNLVRGNIGMGNQDLDSLIGSTRTLAGGLDPNQIKRFYNPYENDVVNSALGDIDTMRRRRLGDIDSAAEMSNAFGGDRNEVARALSNEDFDRTSASTSASLRSAGYNNASQMALANEGLKLGGNQALAQLIQQRRANGTADSAALLGVGGQEQALEQAKRDWMLQRAQAAGNLLTQDKGGSGIISGGPGVDSFGVGLQGLQTGLNLGDSLMDWYKNRPVSGGAPAASGLTTYPYPG